MEYDFNLKRDVPKEISEKASEMAHNYFHHDRQDVRYLIQRAFIDGYVCRALTQEPHE